MNYSAATVKINEGEKKKGMQFPRTRNASLDTPTGHESLRGYCVVYPPPTPRRTASHHATPIPHTPSKHLHEKTERSATSEIAWF